MSKNEKEKILQLARELKEDGEISEQQLEDVFASLYIKGNPIFKN